MSTYAVFVDDPVTGDEIEIFTATRAYDASALAHAFRDAGYHMFTDLWGSVVEDAMISPAVWVRYTLFRYPALHRPVPE